ncbi:MAG: nitrogenase component 1 [Clostridiales Family XIII bacterium]|jgi:nitrogenase molybdenum-iron protein alpha chain|nr:nitrogenase component 1 [Clostridiales Family XIII bacterium]
MNYLKEKQAPKREDRLNTCITYGGTLCGIAERAGCGCLDDGRRGFSQGSICLLLPGLAMIANIPDNLILLHGAVGCGVCLLSQNANSRSGGQARFGRTKDAMWVSTALNEADVINGGEPKLREAILEADKLYRPRTITVVTVCVPGIIGDDADNVISELRADVAAELISVHCEGFKTKIWATAYDAVYHGLAARLLNDPLAPQALLEDELEDAKFRLEKSRTVNLLNVSSMGRVDELELTRLLNALDLNVNIFPVFSDSERMYKVKYAALSISVCPTHDDYFAKYLKDEFGIPYILRHMPIGMDNTDAWIREVAAFFGEEAIADRIIERERARLEAALAPYRAFFKGKKAFISAGEFRALATGALLHELGFEIIAIRAFHHDEFAIPEYEKLKSILGDFVFNVANVQPFEEANLLRRLKPDLHLGHWNDNSTAAKLGIPSHVIYNTGLSYIGYKGAFEMARRLYRQLKNPAFNRNLSRYARLPYRGSWYGESPFKYIKEDARV